MASCVAKRDAWALCSVDANTIRGAIHDCDARAPGYLSGIGVAKGDEGKRTEEGEKGGKDNVGQDLKISH